MESWVGGVGGLVGGVGGVKIYSVATLKGPFPPALPQDRKQMACLFAHGHVPPASLNHRERALEHRVTPK